ncbi:uncharacterized protein AC631_04549 [Debaryomyces fabryi]|uniref:tRNA(Ile)-lysidine synthetase n=1 Tax=Debaryomyces fabryi TaxID=58627 RepID=A0A0V1PTW2_9ASCO|nr:uncharacterized protein AC631_04549 [Debaryomyces fabryi]KRZ99702.1 hypothetical protein AC631_04549 [Debaryomyces fabryi]CUM50967.1 unnamed protein product [Debaryomyces fabryi]
MISNKLFGDVVGSCFKNGTFPERIVVALSGGVDSLCLTYLLGQFKRTYKPNLQITAITIDHKYRSGSRQEAENVGLVVRPWGVDHIVKTLEYEDRDIAEITNFEEVAREKRYDVFEQICRELNVKSLFVAHNLNDQIETFLQRLQQNSSLFGLVGLRAVDYLPRVPRTPTVNNDSIHIVRPLLSFDKSEIIKTCTENNIEWFEDHTNSDIRLTKRNLLRHLVSNVIPSKLSNKDILLEERNALLLVSKESLVETHNEVRSVVHDMQRQIAYLEGYLKEHDLFKFDKRNLLLDICLPFDVLDTYNPMVLSRFFYQNMYPISSVKHYHWSYAKLERHAIPKILKFYNTKKINTADTMKLTYLNVLLSITLDTANKQMQILLTRQPLIHNDFSQVCFNCTLTSQWSDWLNFDRRYWIKMKLQTSNINVSIQPYRHNDVAFRKQLLSAFKGSDSKPFLTHLHEGIPLITAYHNSKPFFALPTYNIYSQADVIDLEWLPKTNLYSL